MQLNDVKKGGRVGKMSKITKQLRVVAKARYQPQ